MVITAGHISWRHDEDVEESDLWLYHFKWGMYMQYIHETYIYYILKPQILLLGKHSGPSGPGFGPL
jgi:hypothetical protein